MKKFKNSSDQLKWVILLLAIAVILPTVCLLWFMTQAIENQTLAVRQQFINIYKAEIEKVLKKAQSNYAEYLDNLKNKFNSSDFAKISLTDLQDVDGLLVYDANQQLIYPTFSTDIASDTNEFIKAAQNEFTDNNAIGSYDSIIASSKSLAVIKRAKLAKARILTKAGENEKALELCKEIVKPADSNNNESEYWRAAGWLFYCDLLHELSKTSPDYNEQFLTEFESSAQSLLNAYTDMHLILTSDQRAAFGSQLLEINGDKFDFRQVVKISPGADANLYFTDYRNSLENKFPMNDVLGRLTHLVQTENCSLKMADKFKWSDFEKPSKDRIYSIPNDVYFYSVLDTGKLHCVIFRTSRFPMETESIFQTLFLMKVGNKFISEDFNIWITGMPGARPKGEMLLEMPLSSQYSPDLKIALYPKNDNFLVEFAGKRKLMYLWTVSIVIIAMLSVTALAGRNIFRQAKFNKLKNDFIATITHELKTPLSSMRVLVDTLLEGKCKDKQHETEYLQLISKENARLSRLIDNFLTFSRMERNKQVFDFCPVSPAEIAKAAAEAVHAKFENAGVNFKVDIAKPLPTIIADKDAITTVLVNLLDNAYKYSYDNKQIELKVFLENSDICFAVKDNGIGLTGRQMKKIFERFYQVDTSLSRRAEGAGLGLSIIKFIVDAHKGKINVESKIGKGSQFSVMLTTNKY